MPAITVHSDTSDAPETAPESAPSWESQARSLAEAQETTTASQRRPLYGFLDDYGRLFDEALKRLRGAKKTALAFSVAAEWMLDNSFILKQALRLIEHDLPAQFYAQLPKLAGGPDAGWPRVYGLARSLLAAEALSTDIDRIKVFVVAYQEKALLTMGELWALPLMLRLVTLQFLAHAIADLTSIEATPGLPLLAPDERLGREEVVANSFASLRLLDAQDWKEFFEDVSLVENLLAGRDPLCVYAQMDFETRDRYRKAVELLAFHSPANELETARRAVELAEQAVLPGQAPGGCAAESFRSGAEAGGMDWLPGSMAQDYRQAHVGYYLIDAGRPQLEAELGYQPPPVERQRRFGLAHAETIYLGAIFGLTLLLALLAAGYAWLAADGGAGARFGWALLAGLLAVLPASQLIIGMLNWLITQVLPPRVLPKMDFSHAPVVYSASKPGAPFDAAYGIPAGCETLVVIPSMLTSLEDVSDLVGQLEQHYLRNPDRRLGFAILTDFADAKQEQAPLDEALVEQAQAQIQVCNQRHGDLGYQPFFFLHRRRLWNPQENVWMGWERKRGKLHELNRLLLGDTETSYQWQFGDRGFLRRVRFVITLDADTVLPRDAAARLVGVLAHPLNGAVFAPESNRVTAGYTIIQPRTEVNISSANQSLFTRLFGGDTGLDLYTHAVSDLYQDFFGAGSFVGKGIYDVAAFERSLEGRIPENALLSHDLFEGEHGRVGLATDVVLIEDFPPNYLVKMLRSLRWVRGDWQLLPWLMSRVPLASGRRGRNRLSAIGRWKILDNLRRSLLTPGVLAALLAGWLILPGRPWVWTLGVVLAMCAPVFSAAIGVLRSGFERSAFSDLQDSAGRVALFFVFLPFEAYLNLRAIGRTLWRLAVTRRNLLQWITSAQSAREIGVHLESRRSYRNLAGAFLFGLLVSIVTALFNRDALPVALLFVFLWMMSPEAAYLLSRPYPFRRETLEEESERRRLRLLARRTWLFFEQFVGPEDHWLPPDHFQEEPRGVVAHRTSPTNIGLALLSNLAAYDMGYIGPLELNARLGTTFETLEKLERYRGHVINWFDTRSLETLRPRYVSTVDSGNLAACLIALAHGVGEIAQSPALRAETLPGFLDSLDLVADLLEKFPQTSAVEALREFIENWRSQAQAPLDDRAHQAAFLRDSFRRTTGRFDSLLAELVEPGEHSADADMAPGQLRRLRLYAQRVHHHLQAALREIELLAPWELWLNRPPEWAQRPDLPSDCRQMYERFIAALAEPLSIADTRPATRLASQRLGLLRATFENWVSDQALLETIRTWCDEQEKSLEQAGMAAITLEIGFNELARRAQRLVDEMDFSFLFDPHRKVFHIGYNLELGRLDSNYYDLLASEARIASLVAIGKSDVPQSHWLHLGRPMTSVAGLNGRKRALLSWSATMFEYIMPPLLLQTYEGTLLYQSEQAAIDQQQAYALQQDTPWGISESGYYRFDTDQNYQYRAFGVPGLGFKRGLGEDLVIAPYASLLATYWRPRSVLENLAALEDLGMEGAFGLYEAVDFTEKRLALGERYQIVKSYMAHHQGMILLALNNFLNDNPMVRRFHADGRIQSVALLLQEQVPHNVPLQDMRTEEEMVVRPDQQQVVTHPWPVPVNTPQPRAYMLSNGRYLTLVTNHGAGTSRWREVDLLRWRSDSTLDPWGSFIYLQDMEQGAYWSATLQPTAVQPEGITVHYSPHMVEFRRRNWDISSMLEVTVPVDDDLEIRRLTLTNHSNRTRRLRVVSYGEVILAPQATDARHPAFNKLFIESEFLPDRSLQLFRRRPRSSDEEPVFLAHTLVLTADQEPDIQHEGDRAQFLGRGHSPRDPLTMENQQRLGGAVGATLDPIFSLGQEFTLPAHGSLRLAYLTTAGDNRDELLARLERYTAWPVIERAFEQARTYAELEMRRLGLTVERLQQIQNLFSLMMYPHPALRAAPDILATNEKGQSALWQYGISGDYPILLIKVGEQEDLSLLQEALRAHAYWRNRTVKIDLVIFNEQGRDYGQELNGQIRRLLNTMEAEAWINRRGGIFILFADQVTQPDRILLETVARAILRSNAGGLAEQLATLDQRPIRLPAFGAVMEPPALMEDTPILARPANLQFDNGYGGFQAGEYVIYLEPGQWTPLPWVNVIANADFGFLASEAGGGYTWALNSGENRLTPWSNDPVSDPPGEALYLRDEETAVFWSPQPLPRRADAPYLVRHGPGYTTWEHHSHGLKQRVRSFVAPDAPVKFIQVRVENTRPRARRITATFYAEWVLGVNPAASKMTIIPEYDDAAQALLARNPYNMEFGERTAFAAASISLHGLTADRTEFLGRAGSLENPLALARIGLASTVRPGLDPCAALQVHLDLQPGEAKEFHFVLGQGANRQAAVDLAAQYQAQDAAGQAWEAVHRFWKDILQTVQVHTPDPAMDLVLNQWLLYQALACRIWGRSAFYQSSGAYGFRDQLQDVMAVVYAAPEIARAHLLRAAAHQFEAGDVLHWWHPPSGRGVRTRISDDLLWLPYVTAHYVLATGDQSVLAEQVAFKQGPQLEPDQEERYGLYEDTSQTYTLLEHCRRAIEKGVTYGPHGLPLFGAGDWNDGMNRVGIEGRGESVWLGWFAYDVLQRFALVCERIGERSEAESYRQIAGKYRAALHESAWDGEWYLRGYYDDGSKLGSADSRECQIDAIAQSWGVISGAADEDRGRQAMRSVYERLVRLDDGLLLLFTPPFDKTPRDPGYIKGYLPGIRENGGQYTHAAIWTVWAATRLGEGGRALELFQTLNPVNHASDREQAELYKVEPYVVAADVYGAPPHTGRGGWTWYTGSSGWLYRLGLEALLGLGMRDGKIVIDPCIPPEWEGFSLRLSRGGATLQIQVENPDGVSRGVRAVYLDDRRLDTGEIPWPEDERDHQARVVLGLEE